MSESELKALSTGDLQVKALGLFRNRPALDPNRPRPVLDAIKSLLTNLVGEMGPTLTPLLISLLKNLLSGAAGASSTEHAELLAAVDELNARYEAEASALSVDFTRLWTLFSAFLLTIAQKIEPDVADLVMAILVELLGGNSEA